MIGYFRRPWNSISDELLVGGANIGAITKQFMIITATSASGSEAGLFIHLAGYRLEFPREGGSHGAAANAEGHLAVWK